MEFLQGCDGQLGRSFTPTPGQQLPPDNYQPQAVPGLHHIVQVACGDSHTIAVSQGGKVYVLQLDQLDSTRWDQVFGWGSLVGGACGWTPGHEVPGGAAAESATSSPRASMVASASMLTRAPSMENVLVVEQTKVCFTL